MKRILETFVDLLFPKYCLGCKQEGVWICESCAATLKPMVHDTCHRCHRIPTVCGFLCQECKALSKLSQVLCCHDYKNELVEKIIIHLKYAYVEELAGLMAADMAQYWEKNGRRDFSSVVIPIPLHKRRLRERGFNQAELLAKMFAKKNDLLCAPHVLTRVHHSMPQVGLSAEERSKNVKGVFSVKDAKGLQGKTVILIDDVYTTGSTLSEAASVLSAEGVKKIIAVTFAHG